jgi:steroid delta-isomerase
MRDHAPDLAAYVDMFESLSPHNLAAQLDPLFADEAYFEDPFNQVVGPQAIRAIFEHMFHTVRQPRFSVLSRALNGDTAFLEWQFHFVDSRFEPYAIVGTSKVVFDSQGKVVSHIDYWDTGRYVYQAVPVLRTVIRWINGKLRAVQ